MQIVNAVNQSISVMDKMNSAMNNPIDTSELEQLRAQVDEIIAAISDLDAELSDVHSPSFEMPDINAPTDGVEVPITPTITDQPQIETPEGVKIPVNPVVGEMPEIETPPPVEVPVQWQSDNLEVFTNTGVERFQSEVQSANDMLNTLNQTQTRIAQTAANTNLFPANMVSDMNGMQTRLQAIQSRIEQIESNPINMGTDAANSELEQLRAQLAQAISAQEEMNAAVDNMDVEAANNAYLRLSSTVSGTERYIRDNTDEQGRFNAAIDEGANKASNLQSMIAKAVGAFAGIAGIRKAIGWIQETTDAFNTQYNAETQLISVLANMLDADYVSQFEVEVNADTSNAINEINGIQDDINAVDIPVSAETKALTTAFDQIKDKAAEIQSKGIYGDEAMIAAAGEFATYFTDVDAITTMMDTLSNYAMGMSGGGELDTTAMVDYATNLGKIMSGAYDAMTKKGFEFTDAQKAVIEGTATNAEYIAVLGDEWESMTEDMRAAATISQIIDESWANLYTNMSNTPQGKIIQLTNAWGDMKEEIGGRLYPFVIKFVDTINKNWGKITAIVDGITEALETMMGVLNWVLEGAIAVSDFFINNWSWIEPIIWGIVAALGVYAGYLAVVKAAEIISAAAKGALAIAEGIHAAAIWATTSATWAEVTAQQGLNAAMYACPIVWIIALIIAIIVALYLIINAINEITGSTISATGIIMGALATVGAFILNTVGVIWNILASLVEFLVNVWTNPEYAIKAFVVNIANAFLKFCLATVTGTQGAIGVVVGIWYGFVQAIKNVVAVIWNAISTVIEAIVNGWNTGVYMVKTFFVTLASAVVSVAASIAQSMGDAASAIANMFIGAINVVIDGLNGLIDVINCIPGVNIGKVGTIAEVSWDFGASSIQNYADDLMDSIGDAPEAWTAPTLELGDIGDAYEQGKEIGADLVSGWESSLSNTISDLEASIADKPEDYWEAPKFEYIDLADAAVAGYEFGEGLEDKVKNFDPASLFGTTDIPSPEDYASAMAGNGIGDGVDDIAGNTGSIADSLDVTEEDLKYLRDIAEQEAINRFTTAEIHIEQTNNNNISSDADLDGIVNGITDAVSEAVEIVTEGVHE